MCSASLPATLSLTTIIFLYGNIQNGDSWSPQCIHTDQLSTPHGMRQHRSLYVANMENKVISKKVHVVGMIQLMRSRKKCVT